MSDLKYPNVSVALVGTDGNAHVIIARVAQALARAGVGPVEVDEWIEEAMSSGSYDGLLQLVMRTVDVS